MTQTHPLGDRVAVRAVAQDANELNVQRRDGIGHTILGAPDFHDGGSDNKLTACWQLSYLPNCQQYRCATPVECLLLLRKPVSSMIK